MESAPRMALESIQVYVITLSEIGFIHSFFSLQEGFPRPFLGSHRELVPL